MHNVGGVPLAESASALAPGQAIEHAIVLSSSPAPTAEATPSVIVLDNSSPIRFRPRKREARDSEEGRHWKKLKVIVEDRFQLVSIVDDMLRSSELLGLVE